MAINKWGNNPGNIEKISQKNNWDINFSKVSKEFIEKKINKDESYFDSYDFDKLSDDFLKFLKLNDKYFDLWAEFIWLDSEKKKYILEKIKVDILKINHIRSINKNRLFNSIKKDFNFTDDQLELINNKISTLKNSKLSTINNKFDDKIDFLIDLWFWKYKCDILSYKKSIESKILKEIWLDISNLSEEDKKKFVSVFYKFWKISYDDLDFIFSNNSITDKLKINIIKYFLEFISYEDLYSLSLISKELEDKIFIQFKKSIWDNALFNEEELRKIFDEIDKSEFLIDLNDIEFDFKTLNLNKKLKEKIVDLYNSDIEIFKESDETILKKLNPVWENEDIHNSFINYLKWDKDINIWVKNTIDNFSNWNLLVITDNNTKLDSYYYIKSVDQWSVLESKNIVLVEINANWWFRKDLKWKETIFTYQNIYDLLKNNKSRDKSYNVRFSTIKESEKNEMVDDKEISSLSELVNKINSHDKEGSDIEFNKDKIVFEVENEKWIFVYNIDKITDNSIFVDQGCHWVIEVSFSKFYEVYVSQNLKRKPKINDYNSFVNELSSKTKINLSLYQLHWWKDKKIVPKSEIWKKEIEDKNYKWLKLFIGDKGDAFYINSISDNTISYSKVKYDEKTKKVKNLKKGWYTSKSFSDFISDANFYKLEAYDKDLEIEKEDNGKDKLKSNLMSKIFSFTSINDIIIWLKFMPEQIKKNLERGSRLKWLKFAQWLAWVFWSKEWSFYLSMKSSVEQEEKNLTEEIITNLKSLWSKDMLNQIKKILTNKNSSEYELIAAMMATVGKYWVLYPKWLKEFSGDNLWFKRLWWTNEFLNKEKQKVRDSKSADGNSKQQKYFTEERLVESWLWERAKNGTIRSRLDKDFWWALAQWTREEMEDWDMKAWNNFTTIWRIEYFLWELKNLSYPNAVWSIKKIFAKNGSSMEMNAIPFILTTSWYAKNFDQVLLNELVWLAYSTPYSSLLFTLKSEDMDKYNNFISELLIDKFWWKESSAYKEFKSFDLINDPNDKVDAIYNFWRKYWSKLIDYINLNDPYIFIKKSSNKAYNDYYNILNGTHSDWEFAIKNDDVKTWVYTKNPVSVSKWWLSIININSSWAFSNEYAKEIFNTYVNSLDKIKNHELDNITEDEKKQAFMDIFQSLSDRIKEIWVSSSEKEKWRPVYEEMMRNFWVSVYSEELYSSKYEYLEKAYNYQKNWNTVSWNVESTKLLLDDLIPVN